MINYLKGRPPALNLTPGTDRLKEAKRIRKERLMAKWKRVAFKTGRLVRFVRLLHDEVIYRPGGRGYTHCQKEFARQL